MPRTAEEETAETIKIKYPFIPSSGNAAAGHTSSWQDASWLVVDSTAHPSGVYVRTFAPILEGNVLTITGSPSAFLGTAVMEAIISSVVQTPQSKSANRGQRRLLGEEGGYLSAQEAARRLNCAIAQVEQKCSTGELIGISTTDGYVYPSWQFVNGHLLNGLEHVLHLLIHHDAWMKLSFMLSKSERLGGVSPLSALRQGRLSEVEQIALTYGEQGAV